LRLFLKDEAQADLDVMDSTLRGFFEAHFEKVLEMPPRRHLSHGLPDFVENVTKQARFAYEIKENVLVIHRCFATHKEYEKWVNSFR